MNAYKCLNFLVPNDMIKGLNKDLIATHFNLTSKLI